MGKAYLFLLLFTFTIVSCHPDQDPTQRDCNYKVHDGLKFKGRIDYCNAIPGKQITFKAMASLTVVDSLFIVSFQSIDTTMAFDYIDTAKVECYYPEGHESYNLYSVNPSDLFIGGMDENGAYLSWRLYITPCFNNNYFFGERN
jgi:hypothetical protein